MGFQDGVNELGRKAKHTANQAASKVTHKASNTFKKKSWLQKNWDSLAYKGKQAADEGKFQANEVLHEGQKNINNFFNDSQSSHKEEKSLWQQIVDWFKEFFEVETGSYYVSQEENTQREQNKQERGEKHKTKDANRKVECDRIRTKYGLDNKEKSTSEPDLSTTQKKNSTQSSGHQRSHSAENVPESMKEAELNSLLQSTEKLSSNTKKLAEQKEKTGKTWGNKLFNRPSKANTSEQQR